MTDVQFLEKTVEDLKEKEKYVVPDWLEKLNQLNVLEKFMNINFSDIEDQNQVLRIAENLQTALKGRGVRKRHNEIVYFDGKEIYPIK